MGGRGSWSQTYRNEMRIGASGRRVGGSSNVDLNARYNPGGRYVSSGTTARHVEKIITQNGYETGVIIDFDTGDVLAAYTGDKASVGFSDRSRGTDDYGKLRGNVMTHNHPSGAACFSQADLYVSAYYGVKEVRAATRGNGTAILRASGRRSDMSALAEAYDRAVAGRMSVSQAQDWLRRNSGRYGCTFRLER